MRANRKPQNDEAKNLVERRGVEIGYGTLFFELQFPKNLKPNQIEILFVSYELKGKRELCYVLQTLKTQSSGC